MGICFSSPAPPAVNAYTGNPFSGNGSSMEKGKNSEEDFDESGKILDKPNLKEFTFAELKTASRNFRLNTLVGDEDFGTFYKGWLDENTLSPSDSHTESAAIAIHINQLNSETSLGFKEWKKEADILGRLSHPNIIRLLGFCCENKQVILVYDFMPKGSLKTHLFRRDLPLPWETRLKIAIGTARGLAFLHSLEKQVIHRDIKPSNILLDENYNAKISGFSLATLGPADEESHISTEVMGTYGYAAPEYLATGHLSVRSDVYGFGVVLLELMTGLRACDENRPTEMRNLVDWAQPFLKKKTKRVKEIMDVRVEGQYTLQAAVQVGALALNCLQQDPIIRPSMQEVSESLKRIRELK